MKIIWFLLGIALTGCGPKSNEDQAKDLITEKLKTSLPDFNNYESVNFSALGTAFLPYEETSQYITNSKDLINFKDSIAVVENLIKENKTPSTGDNYKQKLQQLQDSIMAKNERYNSYKQGYTPEKLFKMSHAYLIKNNSGLEKKTEVEFYFDKELKRVVKVHKVY